MAYSFFHHNDEDSISGCLILLTYIVFDDSDNTVS